MDEKELIKFLTENLSIEVSTDRDGDINVTLKLCGEQISNDWTSIPKNE
jgi:hypothetical protein